MPPLSGRVPGVPTIPLTYLTETTHVEVDSSYVMEPPDSNKDVSNISPVGKDREDECDEQL